MTTFRGGFPHSARLTFMARMIDVRKLAESMGVEICPCGFVAKNCRQHRDGVSIPQPEKKALYSYKVRDPKSGFFPGSLAHQEWKRQYRDKLREFPTDAEKVLIAAFEGNTFLRGLFIFQPIIFGFIPDFGCESAQVIVEVDGSVHNTTAGKRADARRDNIFRRNGWIVKRFSNSQVTNQTADVISSITHCIHARLNGRDTQKITL